MAGILALGAKYAGKLGGLLSFGKKHAGSIATVGKKITTSKHFGEALSMANNVSDIASNISKKKNELHSQAMNLKNQGLQQFQNVKNQALDMRGQLVSHSNNLKNAYHDNVHQIAHQYGQMKSGLLRPIQHDSTSRAYEQTGNTPQFTRQAQRNLVSSGIDYQYQGRGMQRQAPKKIDRGVSS